tara:strand:- start:197 stop:712 length:516 start_codon:yes stop_codon:yes gene_type:complete
MPDPNPYDSRIDDYLNDYQGQYDPLFQKQSKKRVPKQSELQKQKKDSVIRRTLDNVKDTTEDVVDGLTSKQSLTQVAEKKKLSLIDYAILFSSVYGIGAAVGITTGAAKNITPQRNKKPVLYWSMIGLGMFGAYKGYQTATQYKSLQQQLKEESALEKKLSQFISKDKLYR